MSEVFVCCKCNRPVDQPRCKLETTKLKRGVKPTMCPLTYLKAEWKKEKKCAA